MDELSVRVHTDESDSHGRVANVLGRIAHSIQQYVIVLDVNGYKLRDAPGIGPTEEVAARRALSHLIFLNNRRLLGGLPQHVQVSLEGVLEDEAKKRIWAFWNTCRAAARRLSQEGKADSLPPKSMVQRMYDGIGGPWVLNFTEAALKDLRELRKSPKRKDAIRIKLQRIVKGEWGSSVACPLASKSPVQIYQAKPLRNIRIMWQVDVGYCHLTDQEGQIIKIWTILSDHKEVENLLPRLAQLNHQRNKEHIAMAGERFYPTKSTRYVLPTWLLGNAATATREQPTVEGRAPHPGDNCEGPPTISRMPTYTEKFRRVFPISEQMVQDILDSKEISAQHNICLQEVRVINAKKSCLVMGRSGTGKTTCCLFRLLAMHRGVSQGGAVHRQLFVTKSVELLVRVKRCCMKLTRAEASASGERSLQEVDLDIDNNVLADIPASFADLNNTHFPLFCTFDKILSMLHIAYADAVNQLRAARLQASSEKGLPDDDWMDYGRTRDRAGKKINRAFTAPERNAWGHAPNLDVDRDDEGGKPAKKGKQVSFDRFQSLYWPHLDEGLKGHFEPQLVWAEIQSLIKGCESACRVRSGDDGRLRGAISLEEYKKLSERRFPSFSHSRENLYKLFEKYERLKGKYQDHDLMDMIQGLSLMREQLGTASPILLPIDELYVDEVQDLAPSMMRMLLTLLNNPGGFLMVCGDTAQTIAKGSFFRFEDLSSMVFRELSDIDPAGARLKEERLTHNYRSHNGILRLAASVIDLLYIYFPECIDKMERDHSEEEGCLPIVLDTSAFAGDMKDCWMTLFASGAGNTNIEFGAEQAILVRTESAKTWFMELEHRPGFVGTVFDAKGLEFRDVVLFNFFKDSLAKNEWRVFLQQVRARGRPTSAFPPFDHIKMNILESELKELYTALTRTQQRLWIVDDELFEGEKHPMLQYWEVGGCSDAFALVDSSQKFSVETVFASFAHRSTVEEWARQGKFLFENKHYLQAEHCFSRAGEVCRRSRDMSHAFMLHSEAVLFDNREEKEASKARFQEAAMCFQALGLVERAVECYDQAELNRDAGNLLRQQKLFERAGEQYLKCNTFCYNYSRQDAVLEASACFKTVGNFTRALLILKDGKLFEEASELLHQHILQIEPRHRIAVAKHLFLYFENKVEFRDQADREFRCLASYIKDKELIDFLEHHQCYTRLVSQYTAAKQFENLGQTLEKLGRWLEAARSFLDVASPSKQYEFSSAENAIRAVMSPALWRRDESYRYTFVEQADLTRSEASSVLSWAYARCKLSMGGQVWATKCKMLKGMMRKEFKILLNCAKFFQKRRSKHLTTDLEADLAAWELRALEAVLSNPADGNLSIEGRSWLLLSLAETMHNMMMHTDVEPPVQRACEKFFSATSSDQEHFKVTDNMWGACLVQDIVLDSLLEPVFVVKTRSESKHSTRFFLVTKCDGKRAMFRYLLQIAGKLVVGTLESSATFDRLRSIHSCRAQNIEELRCCQKSYLLLVTQMCHSVLVLLDMERQQKSAFSDKFINSFKLKVMQLKARWLDTLLGALQPIALCFQSTSIVYDAIKGLPKAISDELVNQAVEICSNCDAADVGAFLRSILQLIKITQRGNDFTPRFETIRAASTRLVDGRDCHHFAFYQEKLGIKTSYHHRCLLFFECLHLGDAEGALDAGMTYLRFALKFIGEVNPNPVDLVEFIEILVALSLSEKTMCHHLVLPKSYLLNILCRDTLWRSLATKSSARTRCAQCLQQLEELVLSFMQLMVNGNLFAAMKQDQQRQSSFDDWRSLCVRGSMALIFLSVNQQGCAHPVDLKSTVAKIKDLATVPVDVHVMGKFRFPREDQELFLGGCDVDLQQHIECIEYWFTQSIDGLLLVSREDMLELQPGSFRQGFWATAEPVITLKTGQLLLSEQYEWMDLQWMSAGAVEWMQRPLGDNSETGPVAAIARSS